MNKIALAIIALLSTSGAEAQESLVGWSFAAKKESATEAVVTFTARINTGWHIYSLNGKPGGPGKTSLAITRSKEFSLVGTASEPKPLSKFDKNAKMNVSYFEKEVTFQQKVKLNGKSTVVRGQVEYVACNDKQCTPPQTAVFSVSVKL